MGVRLNSSIEWSDTPHFKLNKERCPFLNKDNLCDIMLNLGEDKICEICKHHPRFYNYVENYAECGLGLCCEEAARIIIGKKSHVKLIYDGVFNDLPDIIRLRNNSIEILQDASVSIEERLSTLFSQFNIEPFLYDNKKWISFLNNLEHLENNWSTILKSILIEHNKIDLASFNNYMNGREIEYEQLCVYILYRHLSNAVDHIDFIARIKFVALAYHLLHSIGAYIFSSTNNFTFEDQIELMRLFSAEIEYSDENLDIIFDELSN